ncbi:MAG: patatin family protein [Alphaproteobacteria bacterium]|nr:patatin family protein [Alphaproteobacteria bacterium]
MASSLVLEGGGKRGIYTTGVLDVFLENGIDVDAVFGVSAGAIHGVSFVSRQIGRDIRYNIKYNDDYRFMSFRNWLKTGNVVDVDFCYDELPNKLDKFDYAAFDANPTKFYAVCSNVESGEAEYIRCQDMHYDIKYVQASASLPFFSRIVEVDGKKLLDGGICDSIPLKAAQNHGYDKNIVVLTRPYGYRKKPSHSKWLARKVYRKYPEFVKAMVNRHLMYNDELEYVEKAQKNGTALVIQPSVFIKIGRLETNIEVIKAMYELGRQDALKALDEVKSFLKA